MGFSVQTLVHYGNSCSAVDTNSTEIVGNMGTYNDAVLRILARGSRDCAYSIQVWTCCFVNRTFSLAINGN